MSTSTLTRRMPTKRDGFSWARIPQDSGGVLYRLYRRDMRGVLHIELLPFHSDWECCRCVVARRLREARHRLRDEAKTANSRELAMVLTKLDEAELWRQRDMQMKEPPQNHTAA